MSSLRKRNLFVALALLAALLLFGTPTAAKQKDRLRYNLTAQGKGHVGLAAGRATRLILTINSWSTDAELQEIRDIIAGDDVKQIRKALSKAREVGRLQIPGQPGRDLIYTRKIERDGKTYVLWAADQAWGSIANITTNTEVKFLIAFSVMELDAEGKGTGVISPAVQPAIGDDGEMKIVHSVADPVTLTSVTLQK